MECGQVATVGSPTSHRAVPLRRWLLQVQHGPKGTAETSPSEVHKPTLISVACNHGLQEGNIQGLDSASIEARRGNLFAGDPNPLRRSDSDANAPAQAQSRHAEDIGKGMRLSRQPCHSPICKWHIQAKYMSTNVGGGAPPSECALAIWRFSPQSNRMTVSP